MRGSYQRSKVRLCVAKLQAGGGQACGIQSFPKRSEVSGNYSRLQRRWRRPSRKLMAMDGTRTFLDLLKRPNYLPVPFAAKSSTKLKKLIAGLAVFICDECVELCRGIIAEEGERDANGAAGSTVSDGNPKRSVCVASAWSPAKPTN